MKSSFSTHPPRSGRINIAASARRIEVDNRISLRYYYRIADNIMKQADIFREEKNVLDLYIMLLRFSSLVSETIPYHSEYKSSMPSKKSFLKKRLINALNELEELKPIAENENNKRARPTDQVNGLQNSAHNDMLEHSCSRKNGVMENERAKLFWSNVSRSEGTIFSGFQLADPPKEKLRNWSLSIPPPKEETLSRHSILGPSGLYGQHQPSSAVKHVRYPNDLDLSPIQLPSLYQSVEVAARPKAESPTSTSDCSILESELSVPESAQAPKDDNLNADATEPPSMISFETELPMHPEVVRQPSPPPVLAEVQDLIPAVSSNQITEVQFNVNDSSPGNTVQSESPPMELHFSAKLMDSFMKMAKANTDRNLETCGILAGLLKNKKFYITALIIPKQESTSDTCHTTNEEEIFEVQDKRSLFPLGWIHTHPTQSCFMSSVDVHTHYSYQIMMPEAIAIVMAPQDCSKKHGIFRLTTPGGMSVIRNCHQRGFHHHDLPEDGQPIYKGCSDVYMNPKLDFDVIDLR